MKLSNWAKQQGISYLTAYRWFKSGKIPNSHQTQTGTILVDEKLTDDRVIVVIGRTNNIDEIVNKIKELLKAQ